MLTDRDTLKKMGIKPPASRLAKALRTVLFVTLCIVGAAYVWTTQPNDANSRCVVQDGKRVCAMMD